MNKVRHIVLTALMAVFLCVGAANATLTNGTNLITYTGDGSTVAYSFPYKFLDEDHIIVKVDGTTKTLTTDYTVTGAGNDAGGTITFTSAQASSASIVLSRQVPYTQTTDFSNFDGNPADVTEEALDKLTMMVSQVGEMNARGITVPLGTTLTSNDISGTIDATARLLTVSTSGPATALVSSLSSSSLDTVLASEANGDVLLYNGSDWTNNNVLSDLITGSPLHGEVAYVDSSLDLATLATSSAGAFLTTQSTGANPSWQEVEDFTDATVTTSDRFLFSDATDSGVHKSDTVQGIIDLVTSSGAWAHLASATASNSSSIDFTSASATIDGTYDLYVITVTDLQIQTDTQNLFLRTSTDGGASFDSGASDYQYVNEGRDSGGGGLDSESTGASQILLTGGSPGNDTGELMNGVIYLWNPSEADYTYITHDFGFGMSDGDLGRVMGSGQRKSAADVDGFRLYLGSGNAVTGEVDLYGVQKQ